MIAIATIENEIIFALNLSSLNTSENQDKDNCKYKKKEYRKRELIIL
ncbi:hypothetical protein [Campylobacter concisus]|nr:hypothetical protein [Campylobacter concisus]